VKRRLGSLACMLAASVLVSSGCSATPKGALMLSISTDMQTPKDVDVVSVFVATDGVPKFDYLGRVLPDGTLTLPSTLALVQPENPNAQVHIRITAFQTQGQQENARVLRDVVTTVPSARTALLRLPLDFLDDGSGQGTLPPKYVPEGADGAPEGLTQFDPTTMASKCDPMKLCSTPGQTCQTSVNGVCGSATVNSSTLPAYTQAEVFGDGGLMASGAPESCFDVQTCFAGATPVTNLNGQGTQTCSFPLPSGANSSTLNVALLTQSAGACLASGCYVPLPNDPNEGFTVQGGTVTLAAGVCNKLGNGVTLAVSSGACPTETLSEPVCEPTTPAEVAEAGVPPEAVSDGGGATAQPVDATTTDAAIADATVSDAMTREDSSFADASTDASTDASPEASDAAGCAASALASTWDVTADFSTTTNPSCVWSYGYTETLGSTPLVLFTEVEDYAAELPYWLDPNYDTLGTPSVGQNLSGSTIYSIAPGQVAENPGPKGEYATARWTAPAAGTYSFAVQFLAGNTGIKNGAVLHGTTVLFQESPATNPTFSTTLTMAAGDTFDVATGLTAGETYESCSTPIREVITRVACVPGTTQCASGTQVETCGSNGQWGSPWTCATGTCSAGACSGSTTGVSNPSCAAGGAGMTNCGSASESCCTSLEVPGGTYYRTYDDDGNLTADGGVDLAADGGPTGEADPATVSGFRLDKYLVTVGRFRQFVNAVLPDGSDGGLGWLPAAGSGIHTHLNGGQGLVSAGATSGDGGVEYETGWDAVDWNNTTAVDPTDANLACDSTATWTNTAGSQENLPIDCVNWYEAYAFCIWDGGFLPSEAEWEYAAAGGSEQREYPWGSTAPGTANQYAIYDSYYTGNSTDIAPVGTATLGAGLWGQLDMAGELFEWNLDWYYAIYVDPCTDCAYLLARADARNPSA
jgi:formylglycine-generating enzyme